LPNPSDELTANTTFALANFLGRIGRTEEADSLRAEGKPALDRFLEKERDETKAHNIDALRRPVPPPG
jgi:hypothetical protein